MNITEINNKIENIKQRIDELETEKLSLYILRGQIKNGKNDFGVIDE